MRLPILSGKHRFHLGCGFLKSNKTVLLPVRSSSTPSSAFLNSSIVTLTQSSSVFASFGCASRQRTTMLAVFSDNSSSDNVFDFPPLKNSVPLDKIPLQSHFFVPRFLRSKRHPMPPTCQGRGRLSYKSREMRFPGSSYGAKISLSSLKSIF
jgi:hypothetical protein